MFKEVTRRREVAFGLESRQSLFLALRHNPTPSLVVLLTSLGYMM